MVRGMFVIKILGIIWFCFFVYKTVTSYFDRDEEFGRHCWWAAILSGLFYSTLLPFLAIYYAIKNPFLNPFSRLGHGRRSKRR